MKQFTKSQFIQLLQDAGWSHEQNNQGEISRLEEAVEYFDAETEDMKFADRVHGGVDITSTLDGVTVIAQCGYQYETHKPEDVFLCEFHQADNWMIEGAEITDDAGNKAFTTGESLESFMNENAPRVFCNINEKALLV
jgi:hypothetical protein